MHHQWIVGGSSLTTFARRSSKLSEHRPLTSLVDVREELFGR